MLANTRLESVKGKFWLKRSLMEKKIAIFGGTSFLEMLFLVFLALKLAGKIDWSWWWVFAPVWIPIALVLVLVGGVAILLMLGAAMRRRKRNV